ncbi:MAG: cell division protein FtsL [Gammaproteobacteria bacterium]|nr:cell division protein FtsL [Gammaproteobacteria bacterium]CAJ2376884.1 MAG: Cell division protein FtsL (modular protein) [Arenicellales bacterium IbO2]MDA7961664.1 cell division protein FtsL [Gammaproteobacteria bacterium]MDA7967335.1 cell division protein FtsL [Gammaproteobacteria bacterium]MDA7969845.1 cell division protein FtsL [Gammaproteobacteria bacterium]
MKRAEKKPRKKAARRARTPPPPRRTAASVAIVWALVLASALAVVTVRHQNRQAFVSLRQAEDAQSELQFEHGRLLLERTTWARRRHIVGAARERLGMGEPAPNEIITLTLERE